MFLYIFMSLNLLSCICFCFQLVSQHPTQIPLTASHPHPKLKSYLSLFTYGPSLALMFRLNMLCYGLSIISVHL